eukprot:1857801-Pyramimonas_sp.AAC.1
MGPPEQDDGLPRRFSRGALPGGLDFMVRTVQVICRDQKHSEKSDMYKAREDNSNPRLIIRYVAMN